MNAERLLQIILGVHYSEKSKASQDGEAITSCVFKVMVGATKPEIKQAVEKLFNTKVSSVRVVNVKPKVRRFRGIVGKRKSWKKAYVTLKTGSSIVVSSVSSPSD